MKTLYHESVRTLLQQPNAAGATLPAMSLMYTFLWVFLALQINPALADETETKAAPAAWKNGPIDPKINTDFTAYTVPKRAFRLGLGRTQYGLLKNVHLGTTQFYFLLGVPNISAKVTAIQTPKFDVAFQAEYLSTGDENKDQSTTITATPFRWTASWLAHEKVSLHFGTQWFLVDVESTKEGSGLGPLLTPILGTDVSDDLENALGASRYTDAHFSITQSRLAVDWRINRRDSVILQSNSFVLMNAMVISGVQIAPEGAEGQEVDLGGAARLQVPLKETVPAVASLSWQWSWERFHLRVGIPITSGASVLFAIPQAFDMYWVLGGQPKRVRG